MSGTLKIRSIWDVGLEKNAKDILNTVQNNDEVLELAEQRTFMTTLRKRQKNGWDVFYTMTRY